MFNVLDIHNKYTVRIFIVSLYKITKIIDPTHPPPPPLTSVDVPPHLLLELMSLTRGGVRWGGGGVRWWGGLLDVGYVEGVRWGGGYVAGGGGVRWGGGESGTSTREDRSKTAQILLEKPFKNHRKK